jgi:MFS family permease
MFEPGILMQPDTTVPTRSKSLPSLAHTLLIATLIQIIATAAVLALTALAPTIAADLQIDAYWIGYQISAIYGAGVFTSAIAGTLVARYGPARIEQATLACCAFGFVGLASGSLPLLLLATILIGIGYGLNNPAASQLLSRVTPARQRNLVFSLKQSGVPLGGIVASLGFPFLAREGNWQLALVAGAGASILIWIWLAASHADSIALKIAKAPFGRGFLVEQSTIWRHEKLRTLSILGFLYSGLQLSMSAFAVVALVHDAGWSLLQAGSVAAAMQLAGAFGRIGWGTIADRIGGGFRTLAIIGGLSGSCCILLFFLPHLPGAAQVLLFVVMGAISIGWNGVLLAEVARNAPAHQVGAMTGGVLVYTFLGVMVGPSSFAMIYALSKNYGASFLSFSVLGFAGMLLAFAVHRRNVQA